MKNYDLNRLYTDDEVIAAINKNDGNKSQAAKELGCTRGTLYRHIRAIEHTPGLKIFDDSSISDDISSKEICNINERHDAKEVIKAIYKSDGKKYKIYEQLMCTPNLLNHYRHIYPSVEGVYRAIIYKGKNKKKIKGIENFSSKRYTDGEIIIVINKNGGNRSEAAKELGCSVSTLYKYLKRMKLQPDFTNEQIKDFSSRRYTDDEIITIVNKNDGNKSKAAKELGCSRHTLYKYLKHIAI